MKQFHEKHQSQELSRVLHVARFYFGILNVKQVHHDFVQELFKQRSQIRVNLVWQVYFQSSFFYILLAQEVELVRFVIFLNQSQKDVSMFNLGEN